MNVAHNGNGNFIHFPFLHLPKHSSYVRLCVLARIKYSQQMPSQSLFHFSAERDLEATEAAGNVTGSQNGTEK